MARIEPNLAATVRNWMQRINGVNFLKGTQARQMMGNYKGETGVVLCFRYPPRAAFGLAPHPSWMTIRVEIDGGQVVVTAGLMCPEPTWVALEAGEHSIDVYSEPGASALMATQFGLEESCARILDVFPRRHRGLLPGFVGPRITVE